MTDPNARVIEGAAEAGARRLYRSTTNRSVSGVCGGLGEYLGIDVGVVRLVWLVSAFLTVGLTLLIYVLLAVVLPEEPADVAAHKVVKTSDLWQRIRTNRALLLGAILLLLGALLLFNNFGWLPVRLDALWELAWNLFWPLFLIGLGVYLLFSLNGHGVDWERLRARGARLPLRRSRRNRVIAGVCGGIAAYLKVDAVLVRLVWTLLTVLTLGTISVVLYALAVVFIPWDDAQP